MVITVIMILSFVLLSYYRAQMNATLNVNVETFPIHSWNDVDKSDYKILIPVGTYLESYFKNSPVGSLKHKLYEEKVATVPENMHIDTNQYYKTVLNLLKGNYIAVDHVEPYQFYEEYPCDIVELKSMQ